MGTQFDPRVARALIRMIREGRIDSGEMIAAEEQHLKEVTQIWSRVMEKHEEKIAGKILTDDLTGACSRGTGEKLMRQALQEAGGGTLMLFDLDHFRRVNDTTGFVRGDLFLRVTADGIRSMGREMIFSRFGGDEFAALFPGLDSREEAAGALETFERNLEREIAENPELEGLSVSVGAVVYSGGADFATLF